jgi:hypothetical protein
MSRRSRHRRDDFGGGENWFSSLLKPFRRFFSKIGGRDRSLERAASSEPLWKSLLLLVPRLLYELFRFLIFDWSTSRKGKAFLYALPALGTVALAIAILSVAAWKLETSREPFYLGRLAFSQEEKDHKFAKSCALKLVDLNPSDENKYKLALAIRQLDDFNSAFDLMSSLAPEDKVLEQRSTISNSTAEETKQTEATPETTDPAGEQVAKTENEPEAAPINEAADEASAESAEPNLVYTGYAPAHLWVADTAAFATELTLSAEERKSKALIHYSAAFELEKDENSPESIYAALRLSELQAQNNDLAGAEKTLRIAAGKPVITLLHLQAIARLLAILKQQDKVDEIKASADGLEPRLFKLASSMPDSIEPWQALVDVSSQAENYRIADEYIQSGLAMAKNPETRRGLLQLRAALLMRQAMQMKEVDQEARYLEKFGYLATAISVDPTNENLYVAMLEYVDLNEQNPAEDDFLRLALGTGKTPAITHVVLGLRDAQRNQGAAAVNHWEIADTQTDRAEWLCGMFARLLLKAKSLSTDEYFQFLGICDKHYPNQPMLQLANAEALLLLRQDHAQALPLLEKILTANENFIAAREAYVTALKASGRENEAEEESLKLKRQIADAQKQKGQASVEKDEAGKNSPK